MFNPIVGSIDCCARAAIGHVVAAPKRAMNSRRFIFSPRLRIMLILAFNSGHQNRNSRLEKWGATVRLRSSNPELRMIAIGHSRPGRASSKSGHVRHSPKAERNFRLAKSRWAVDGSAAEVFLHYYT
jgi:hypothetical protein